MKFLIMHISPVYGSFLALKSKYSPQHPARTTSTFFSLGEGRGFIPIQKNNKNSEFVYFDQN
jgi:hypothetical protein